MTEKPSSPTTQEPNGAAVGTCGCGGYGVLYDRDTERVIGRCHDSLDRDLWRHVGDEIKREQISQHNVREAQSVLIHAVAALARGDGLPSPIEEDHKQKTYSAGRVAEMASDRLEIDKLRAFHIRGAARLLVDEINSLRDENKRLKQELSSGAGR